MVDFLIIGSMMSVIYKDIFPLIKDGDVNFGWNNVVEFEGGVKFGNIRWFSNISDYCPPPLVLSKKYVEGYYKKFDNFDAINIDRIEDIPDFDGLMGVPVTFLDKWNPGMFEVIGMAHSGGGGLDMFLAMVEGKLTYSRILIKRK